MILASALFRATSAPEDAAALLLAMAYGRKDAEVSPQTASSISSVGLRRGKGVGQALSLVARLRADGSLPNTANIELDRMLRVIEGASAS